MKVAVIDYEIGNLASVLQGLKYAGLEPVLTRKKEEIMGSKAVVLPGVGAFAKGMENLNKYGLTDILHEAAKNNKLILGICLGMQLLFEESDEHGIHKGLGLLPGKVTRFPEGLKIPHMGWNTLQLKKEHAIISEMPKESYVYFVHSYYVSQSIQNHIVASTQYGIEFPAIVCFNNIVGIQFHPEKSSRIGQKMLRNFKGMVEDVDNTGN